MKQDSIVELLFVAGSSQDDKGRRVLVRESGTENWIYPDPGATDVDIQLLGIEPGQKVQIEAFFSGTGQPPGAVG